MFGRRPDADRVIEGLWIGAAPSDGQARRLAASGITAVVDLRAEEHSRVAWPSDVLVVSHPLVDHGTPTVEQLSSAAGRVSRLLKDGQEVLVHCRAGVERSPTVACAALVLQGWSLRDAYRRVTGSRGGAAPTAGQMRTLHEFADRHGVPPVELS